MALADALPLMVREFVRDRWGPFQMATLCYRLTR